eukprot:316906-Prymnesium_polylepis.3
MHPMRCSAAPSTLMAPDAWPLRMVCASLTRPPTMVSALSPAAAGSAPEALSGLTEASMRQSVRRSSPPSTLTWPTSRTFEMCTGGAPGATITSSGWMASAGRIVASAAPTIEICQRENARKQLRGKSERGARADDARLGATACTSLVAVRLSKTIVDSSACCPSSSVSLVGAPLAPVLSCSSACVSSRPDATPRSRTGGGGKGSGGEGGGADGGGCGERRPQVTSTRATAASPHCPSSGMYSKRNAAE